MTRLPFPLALLAATLAFSAPAAHALFKVVGPDGKVTYTDRAPSTSDSRVTPVSADTGRAAEAALPFALRQVATRFPVTLYTASNCSDACAQGRSWLAKRGVPYTERVAETDEEREAWPRIVGGLEAPVLKVGGQMLRGFAPAAWEETLDTVKKAGRKPSSSPLRKLRGCAPRTPARMTRWRFYEAFKLRRVFPKRTCSAVLTRSAISLPSRRCRNVESRLPPTATTVPGSTPACWLPP